MRHFLLLTLVLFISAPAPAQQLDYLPGRLIVQLGADVDAKRWAKEQADLTGFQVLGRAKNIWLARYDHGATSLNDLRRRLAHDPAVHATQPDRPIELRATPDDPLYPELWQFNNSGQYNGGRPGADLNIEPAWNTTTGGMTVNGDEIVVAVLDDGSDLTHPDLIDNLWINRGETPNNGQDDDHNGYVDDYYGFDTANNDGNPNAESFNAHGTPVAGIIGAVGNNGLGVTGVNWDVKIMTVRNAFLDSESEVLQAYLYVLEQRNRYDASGGTEGAYVVATNASWGRAYGDVDDSPIWCSLYDDLGAAGILNVGATANANIDVDAVGDLPTNCPSEYLIGVTNLNTFGNRVDQAAVGSESIDLGAHGQQVLTTARGGGYRRFSGTSSATPHVTGAAALLYSAPCEAFGELLRADPAAAARYIRQILLETARPNAELAGKTVTGGQLDVSAAMQRLMEDCNRCFAPTGFTVQPLPGSASTLSVNYNAITSIDDATLRYRVVGGNDWTEVNDPPLPFTLADLPACVAYEFELRAGCDGEGVTTQRVTASTDGCCVIPEDFRISADPNQFFTARWTRPLAGTRYNVRYRRLGTAGWTTRTSSQGALGLAGGFEPCTPYEFEFRTICDGAETAFGSRMTVTSRGCGACIEEEYCTPNGFTNNDEWIAEVNVANLLDNVTGADRGGYGNYTGAELTLVQGGVYPTTLRPGNRDRVGTEAFKVYVDWNQDGVLTSGEIITELTSTGGDPVTFDLVVPDDAPLLSTRMRVIMNFIRVSGGACTSGQIGEYEDYCFNVQAREGCPAPTSLTARYDLTEGRTLLAWSASATAGNEYRVRYRPRDSQDSWTTKETTGINLKIDNLNLCGEYEVELASLCGGTPGETRLFYFSELCVGTDGVELAGKDWALHPNPAKDLLQVTILGRLQPQRVRLLDVSGRLTLDVPHPATGAPINLSALPAGMYFVELVASDGRRGVKKLIVR